MPKHEIKYCPKCNQPFECKIGSIFICQCWAVSLNEEERQYVKEKYDDCICANCLMTEKEEYKVEQLRKLRFSPNPFTIDSCYCKIKVNKVKVMPLMSWDIHSMYLLDHLRRPSNADLTVLGEFKSAFEWQIDLESILNDTQYDSLVLTNDQIRIQWVSLGFKKMTGYSPSFAIGKSPRILQGEGTHPDTVNQIRQKIRLKQPFEETVLNYRKNGETYYCHLRVFPITTSEDKLTHFLALEREIIDDSTK